MGLIKKMRMLIACAVVLAIAGGFVIHHDVKAGVLQLTNDEVLTSSRIEISGFQMKEAYSEDGGADITFRTVAEAPGVGETITVDGREYTVAHMGTIYVLDPDCSGVTANRVLSKDYTVLDEASYTDDGFIQYYKGANYYQGNNRTFGFVATEDGCLETKTSDGMEITTYVRTMTGMNKHIANSIQFRAFVVATDGTIIYSEKAWTTSIARLSYEIYSKRVMSTKEGHDYLYKNILNSTLLAKIYEADKAYPYYLNSEIDYNWSDIVP